MSLCTLGMAEEFRDDGIAFNSLWPRTLVATAAVQNLLGGDEAMKRARTPRDLRRRRLRRADAPEPRMHRQLLPLRGRPGRGGRNRLRGLRRRAGGGAAGRPLRGRGQPARHQLRPVARFTGCRQQSMTQFVAALAVCASVEDDHRRHHHKDQSCARERRQLRAPPGSARADQRCYRSAEWRTSGCAASGTRRARPGRSPHRRRARRRGRVRGTRSPSPIVFFIPRATSTIPATITKCT